MLKLKRHILHWPGTLLLTAMCFSAFVAQASGFSYGYAGTQHAHEASASLKKARWAADAKTGFGDDRGRSSIYFLHPVHFYLLPPPPANVAAPIASIAEAVIGELDFHATPAYATTRLRGPPFSRS